LEFGLIENLFDIGFGIHLVKKIVADLKKDNDFKEWAENFDNYFLRAAKMFISWVEKQQKKNKHFGIGSPVDPGDTKDPVKIINTLKPTKPYGLLFYIFKEDGYSKKRIVPWEIIPTRDAANFLAAPFLYEDIITSKGMIIVNLGEIKEKIDKRIKEKA